MKWEKQRFGDVIEFNPRVSLEKGIEYPYLPMEEIQPGRKFNPPSNTRVYKSGGARFANNDTVLARITPCLENGKVSKIAHLEGGLGFGSTEYFVFRAIEGKTDPDYIYYLAASDIVRQPAIKSMVGASGRQRADRGVVENLMIPFPDVETQKYIAGILSAYDDLIDNNNRRIALLEEAIHRLYREWFVHLRFPGHEHTPVVAGVPEGWEKRPLAEIAHINAESIRKNSAPENIEYIDISSVGTGIVNEIKAIDFADAPSRARRIVNHGDIIWSTVRPGNRAYSLILNPNPNTIASTGFAVLTAQNVPFTFLYQAVITDEFVEHMAKVAKGAAYPAVSTSDFEKVKILVPSPSLLNEFEQMAKPIARQTQTLRLQNEKLREARDALLPRLMNGSLVV